MHEDTTPAEVADEIGIIAHRVRALAQTELHYAENIHQERRARELLKIAAELKALDGSTDAVEAELRLLTEPPSLTPYSGAEAALLDGDGRILLIRREDDGLWALPGGASDVGETPAETAARELFEETGVVARPTALVGVYDSRLSGTRSWAHLYHFVFLCEVESAQTPIAGPETTDVGWFAATALPALSPGHAFRVDDLFAFMRSGRKAAYFDGLRD